METTDRDLIHSLLPLPSPAQSPFSASAKADAPTILAAGTSPFAAAMKGTHAADPRYYTGCTSFPVSWGWLQFPGELFHDRVL